MCKFFAISFRFFQLSNFVIIDFVRVRIVIALTICMCVTVSVSVSMCSNFICLLLYIDAINYD